MFINRFMWFQRVIKHFIIELGNYRLTTLYVSFLVLTFQVRLVRAQLLLHRPLHFNIITRLIDVNTYERTSENDGAVIAHQSNWSASEMGGWAVIISNYYLLKSHNNWDLLNWNAFAHQRATQLKCALKPIGGCAQKKEARHLECT